MTMWFDATKKKNNKRRFIFYIFEIVFIVQVETTTGKLILKYSVTIPEPRMVISAPTVMRLSWGFFQVTKQEKKKEKSDCQSSDAKMCLGKQSRHVSAANTV